MKTIEINVHPRVQGKSEIQACRKAELIPAIVYGPKAENLILAVEAKDAKKYFNRHHENAIFNLNSKDKKLHGLKVLVKDITYHKLNRSFLHVDLYAADLTKSIRVPVEIKFTGEAIGIKAGGLFQVLLRQVEVECLPTDIPSELTIDVSDLELNKSKHASDLTMPTNVKLVTDPKQAIANCAVLAAEEEPVAAAAAAPAEGTAAATPGAAPAAGATAAPGAAPAAGAKPAADKKEGKK